MPRNALPVSLYRPTDDDLAQNRQGRVSRRQKKELARHINNQGNKIIIWLVLILALFFTLPFVFILPVVLVASWLDMPQAQWFSVVWAGGVLLISVGVVIYFCRPHVAELLAMARVNRDAKRGKVQRAIGSVKLEKPNGRDIQHFSMHIRNRRLIVDDEQFFSLHDGQAYVVYFLPQSLVVLNTEEVKSTPPPATQTG